MITSLEQLDLNKRYTYSDYLTWQFDEMVELIRGKIFPMSPAPSRIHQQVSSNLLRLIFKFFDNQSCQVFHAPFDVRLPLPENQQKDGKIDTVVQPDICIICDPTKLDDRGCNGAPDWIIEILSKSTSEKDLTEKYDIYQNAGVSEYWIVHPHEATVMIFRLDENGQYKSVREKPFVRSESVPTNVFSDFQIDLKEVFPD